MDIRILIEPRAEKKWLVDFLEKRDLEVVNEGPTVIHYFGFKPKELFQLINKWEPQLVVLNSKKIKIGTKATSHLLSKIHNWIIEPIDDLNDVLTNGQIWTDNAKLAQIYYQRLNLQREIIELKPKKRRTLWRPDLRHIFDWSRFSRFMYWD